MNKVSAQQIASLELRIARLEKEAGIIRGLTSIVKRLGNIPLNIVKRIAGALKDLGLTVLKPMNYRNIQAMEDRLAASLGIRIQEVITSGYFPTGDSLVLEEFNLKSPIKSTFRKAGKIVLPLDKMINLTYEGGEQKRLKAAYLSWKSDYGHFVKDIQDIKVGNYKQSNDTFLKYMKRDSKMLYRLFKAFLDLAPAVATTVLSATNWVAYKAIFILMFKHGQTLAQINEAQKAYGGLMALPGHATLGVAAMGSLLLNLIEKAFYRFGVNVDAFDAESAGKTASSHPRVASVIRLLENGQVEKTATSFGKYKGLVMQVQRARDTRTLDQLEDTIKEIMRTEGRSKEILSALKYVGVKRKDLRRSY